MKAFYSLRLPALVLKKAYTNGVSHAFNGILVQAPKVERGQIIEAAFSLLDEAGLDGLSLRRLAASLKIKAPSLYWHFANKQDLIEGLADALVADVTTNLTEGESWDDGIRALSCEFRQALLRHRDGARVFAGTYVVTDNVVSISETMIGLFLRSGIDVTFATACSFSVAYYILGFVIEEQALVPESGVSLSVVKESFLKVAQKKYPNSWAARDALFSVDFDARFKAGIEIIIAGVKQQAHSLFPGGVATYTTTAQVERRRATNGKSKK